MTPKEFIQQLQLQNSSYGNPEQASNQANSIEALSTDIYTDRKRFIYELLQNADDASVNNGHLIVHFWFFDGWLAVSHQGEPFTEVDIESIASVGDGNKQGDENKTGFKGIGFKSVFSHSVKATILSGEYCFSFDSAYWNDYWDKKWGNKQEWTSTRNQKGKSTIVKMPWQIIPIWDDLPAELRQKFSEYKVSTLIKYDDTATLLRDVKSLFSDSNIILFLRSRNVRITIDGENTQETIEKAMTSENTVTIKYDGRQISEWLIKSFRFDIDEGVKFAIQSDLKIPKKLKSSSRTELSFAVPISNGKINKLDESSRLIFSYLPTSVNYGFPFLLNGSFITDAGRQHLHEDTLWNQWLMEKLPHLLFSWLGEITELRTQLSRQILKLIPDKFIGANSLKQAFNKGYDEALRTIPFLPSLSGVLIKAKEAIFDVDDWCQVLGEKYFLRFLNELGNGYNDQSFIIELKPVSKLKGIGVLIPDSKTIISFFDTPLGTEFIEAHRSSNAELVRVLFNQTNKLEGENYYRWMDKLEGLPFLLDSENNFQSPAELFFPNAEFSENLDEETPIINKEVFAELETLKEIIEWLEKLGMQEFYDTSYVEKVIIPKSDSIITPENAIEYGRYLFELYKKGLLDNFFQALQAFPLLTKEGNCRPANQLFLSDFYDPVTLMEKHFEEEDIFCSANYLERGKDMKSEWKSFLLKLGVKEKMVLETIKGQRTIMKSTFNIETDFFQNKTTVPGYSHYQYDTFKVVRISFIEKCINNHPFAKLFWSNIFTLDEISIFDIQNNTKTRGYWGFYNMPGKTYGDILESYIEWIFENRNILPTTDGKCTTPGNLFVNETEIQEIAGKYLPVFDCGIPVAPEWKEYLKFKNKLQLEDYLNILECISKEEDEEECKENQKRVYKIYEALSALTFHSSEITKIKKWSKDNRLLGADGNFHAPNKLYFINVPDFAPSSEFGYLIKTARDTPGKIVDLLKLFGVNVIENKKLTVSNDAVKIQSLKDKLRQIAPLLNLIQIKDKSILWGESMDNLKEKLSKLSCYKVSDLELVVHCGEERIAQSKRAFLNYGNLYYRGSWENPIALDFIVSELHSYLGIKRTNKHMLQTLLQIPYHEGLEYLEELGYDIDEIPLINQVNEEPPVILPRTGGGYNKSKEEIGLLGEQFTFQELKRIYAQKYGREVISTDTGFEIPRAVEVHWRNISGVSYENHDFLILEENEKIYLDSKATPYGEQYHIEFELTASEFSLMQNVKHYCIARVFCTGEDFEESGTYVRFIGMELIDFSSPSWSMSPNNRGLA